MRLYFSPFASLKWLDEWLTFHFEGVGTLECYPCHFARYFGLTLLNFQPELS